jgi:hypothetical protein
MQWIRTVLREVYGLFVDDAAFAIAILVWLAIMWLLVKNLHTAASGWIGGLVFFGGLAAILIESTARYSRPRRSK